MLTVRTPGDVLSYLEMCQEEGASLQQGMNFRLRGGTSVILMSVRPGAPYADQVQEEGSVLVYEGQSASPVTASVLRTLPSVTSTVSPARTALDGFTRSPFRCTRPPRTALVAAWRVLNRRAAHSHFSMRI